ncbi:MAG: DNA repair protein RecO [Patescibacteria group bacterium]
MSLVKTEAIILGRKNFRVNDRIFLLYGKNEGKLELLGKGTRKKESKLAGSLEAFALADIMFARGRGFDYVTAVKVLKKYNIYQSLLVSGWLALIVEIINSHLKPKYKEKEIFDLLKNLLENLEKNMDEEKSLNLILAAIFSLINILGFCPELFFCQECRAKISPPDNYFSSAKGGLLCPSCRKTDPSSIKVSAPAIKIIRFFLNNDLDRVAVLQIKRENYLELKRVLFIYLPYILEDEFKSLRFIEKAATPT